MSESGTTERRVMTRFMYYCQRTGRLPGDQLGLGETYLVKTLSLIMRC